MIKFGTAGFREVIGDKFTKANVQKITQALANKIKKDKLSTAVAVGFDRRFLSEIASIWVAEVLAGNGIQVKLYKKPTPTPSVMYVVKEDNLDYGLMITASHNPHYYNGIKIIEKGGKDASEELTNEIAKLANKNLKIKTINYSLALKNKTIIEIDDIAKYIKNIQKFVSTNLQNSDIKILFNSMHGVTGECARLLAKSYNLTNLHIINENEDPYFERQLPSPSEDILEEFKKEVKKGKYAIGLACDGDGDRIGVVDEKGTYYTANTILGVVYYYLIKYRKLNGDIVKSQPTSYLLDLLAEKFNTKCHAVPVGFKWVSTKMFETDALLGGESSGGLTMRGYIPSKDSSFAVSLILDTIATIGKPLSKIVKEVYDFCGYNSIYIEKGLKVKKKKKLMKSLKVSRPNFDKEPIETIQQPDGVKYVFDDNSFVNIRFSGTEDLLRYYLEFKNETMCERVIKDILDYVKKIEK